MSSSKKFFSSRFVTTRRGSGSKKVDKSESGQDDERVVMGFDVSVEGPTEDKEAPVHPVIVEGDGDNGGDSEKSSSDSGKSKDSEKTLVNTEEERDSADTSYASSAEEANLKETGMVDESSRSREHISCDSELTFMSEAFTPKIEITRQMLPIEEDNDESDDAAGDERASADSSVKTPEEMANIFKQVADLSGGSQTKDNTSEECADPHEHVRKKPLVKFTISVESNPEEESRDAELDMAMGPNSVFGASKPTPKQNLFGLKLNLLDGDTFSSSPECGNSPEIVLSSGDRSRHHSLNEGAVTSTPTSGRSRHFSGYSFNYVTRRNLSRDNAFDEFSNEEALSVSSSEFSPGSTLSSMGLEKFHTADELSDDACSIDGRTKDSNESGDDSSLRSSSDQSLLMPINKQLKIVTSVDRALYHRRRSFCTKQDRFSNLGRSSSENFEHIAFVDFMRRMKLISLVKHFPPSMTLTNFK